MGRGEEEILATIPVKVKSSPKKAQPINSSTELQPFPEVSEGAKVFGKTVTTIEPDATSVAGLLVQFQGHPTKRMIVSESYMQKYYPKAVANYYRRIWLPEPPIDLTWPLLVSRKTLRCG